MSISTDGQICYGIYFEEDFEFPWDADEYESDIEEWWLAVNNYVNPLPDPYDENGRKPDTTEQQINEYFRHRREWLKSHPVPVKPVNYQSREVPAYLLAVPSSLMTARRGYPEVFDPEALTVPDTERQALINLCEQYGIKTLTPPAWYLSSYWG